MLIDHVESVTFTNDPILNLTASVNKNSIHAKKIDIGVYEIGHFGSSHILPSFEHYPDLENIECYGVCDNVEQIFEKEPMLTTSHRKFLITLTKVMKATQSPIGGWRWHKWGEYIGTHDIQYEYLYDEKDIEQVFCYHIYEKK